MAQTQADYLEYRCIEFNDQYGSFKYFLCQVYKNGEAYGPSFDARTHEEMHAWLRLHTGGYAGSKPSFGNDEGAAA